MGHALGAGLGLNMKVSRLRSVRNERLRSEKSHPRLSEELRIILLTRMDCNIGHAMKILDQFRLLICEEIDDGRKHP